MCAFFKKTNVSGIGYQSLKQYHIFPYHANYPWFLRMIEFFFHANSFSFSLYLLPHTHTHTHNQWCYPQVEPTFILVRIISRKSGLSNCNIFFFFFLCLHSASKEVKIGYISLFIWSSGVVGMLPTIFYLSRKVPFLKDFIVCNHHFRQKNISTFFFFFFKFTFFLLFCHLE